MTEKSPYTRLSIDRKPLLYRLRSELKLPKNYKARLQAQLKRYGEKKTPEELKIHILDDWKKHTAELTIFWETVEKIHEDVLADLYNHWSKLHEEVIELEAMIDMLDLLKAEECRLTFHEYRKAEIKEYMG